ncbi:unnamed protein product [Ixodes pacificus]
MYTFKKHAWHGQDSGRSWAVLALASWVEFISTMTIRSSGVFCLAIVDYFHVTREVASGPVTLSMSARFMGAILLGLMCELWSCQRVLLVCTSVASFGIGICYFAPNVAFISCFLGVLHGCALSGLSVGLQVLVCQHFKKWRTTACSLISAPQCLNVFFAPQLASFFLAQYGTPALFLLLGAMSLNAVPAVLAVGSPSLFTGKSKHAVDRECQLVPEEQGLYSSDNEDSGGRSEAQAEEETLLTCRRTTPTQSTSQPTIAPSSEELAGGRPFGRNNFKRLLKDSLKAFTSLRFLVDVLSFVIHVYTMTTFFMVHVDLPQDRGIDPSNAIYLVHFYSISEMVMRMLGGFIVDRGYISLPLSMLLSFLGGSVACEGIAWSTSMVSFGISSLLLGLSEGMVIGMMAPLIIRDFKDQSLAIMLGGLRFVIGVVLLTRPPLVRYFRDQIGSYSGLAHVLAAANALGALVWFVRVLYLRYLCETKNNSSPDGSSRTSRMRDFPPRLEEMGNMNVVPLCSPYAETWLGFQNVCA